VLLFQLAQFLFTKSQLLVVENKLCLLGQIGFPQHVLRIANSANLASFPLPLQENSLLAKFLTHRATIADEQGAEVTLLLAEVLLDCDALRTNLAFLRRLVLVSFDF